MVMCLHLIVFVNRLTAVPWDAQLRYNWVDGGSLGNFGRQEISPAQSAQSQGMAKHTYEALQTTPCPCLILSALIWSTSALYKCIAPTVLHNVMEPVLLLCSTEADPGGTVARLHLPLAVCHMCSEL